MTLAPPEARALAIAKPMPLVDPVTIAHLPFNGLFLPRVPEATG
jgi:hypothetical protein